MSVKHWHTWCQNYFFGTWNAFGKPDNSGLLSNSYDTNIRYALRMAMLTNEDFLLKDSGKVVVVFEWKLTLHFKNRIPRSIIAVVMIRAILCQFCVRDFMDLPAINKRKNERKKKTVLLSTKVFQMNRALNNSLWWAYPVRSPYFEASMPIHWRDKSKTLKIEPTQQAIVCSYNIRMRGKKIVCLATDSTRVVWINWLSW